MTVPARQSLLDLLFGRDARRADDHASYSQELHLKYLERFMRSRTFLLFLAEQDLLQLPGRVNRSAAVGATNWSLKGPLMEDLLNLAPANPLLDLLTATERIMHSARRHGWDPFPPPNHENPDIALNEPHHLVQQARRIGDTFQVFTSLHPNSWPLGQFFVEVALHFPKTVELAGTRVLMKLFGVHPRGLHFFKGDLPVPQEGPFGYQIDVKKIEDGSVILSRGGENFDRLHGLPAAA
jgi:hypothetical protein